MLDQEYDVEIVLANTSFSEEPGNQGTGIDVRVTTLSIVLACTTASCATQLPGTVTFLPQAGNGCVQSLAGCVTGCQVDPMNANRVQIMLTGTCTLPADAFDVTMATIRVRQNLLPNQFFMRSSVRYDGTAGTCVAGACDNAGPPPHTCMNSDPNCNWSALAVPSASGSTMLQPVPRPCDLSAPTCGGVCPPNQQCTPTAGGGCVCQTPCDLSGPTCGGICPPNQQCTPTAGGGCVCQTPCDLSGPTCGGICPPNQVCTPTAGGGCVCQVPCDLSGPTCGGTCPPGTQCTPTAGGGCTCVPIECGTINSGPCVIRVTPPSGTPLGATFGSLQAAVNQAPNGTATTPTVIDVRGVCVGITFINRRSNLVIQGVMPTTCPPGADLPSTLRGDPNASPPSGSQGEVVKVLDSTNIVVRYLNIVDGGEHDGLEFKETTNSLADCNCVARNDEGYELDTASNSKTIDSLVTDNETGIRLHDGAVDNMVMGNISERNAMHGIMLLDSDTERNMVAGNTTRANGIDCIHLDEADVNVVESNVVGGGAATPQLDCGREDIRVQNDADRNRFSDNVDPDGMLLRINCTRTSSSGNTGNNCQ
jgi:hypothetical protein